MVARMGVSNGAMVCNGSVGALQDVVRKRHSDVRKRWPGTATADSRWTSTRTSACMTKLPQSQCCRRRLVTWTADAPEAAVATGTDRRPSVFFGTSKQASDQKQVPILVPSRAENGALWLALRAYDDALDSTEGQPKVDGESSQGGRRKGKAGATLRTGVHQKETTCTERAGRKNPVHPTGFEPVTSGSVDRCSIQLS